MSKYKCNYCGAPKDSILAICPFCNNQGNNLIKFNSLFLRKNINPWLIRTKNQINNKVVQPGVAYLRNQKLIQRGKILLENQNILSDKQIEFLNNNRKIVFSKRRNIAILIVLPLSLLAFSTLNDPYRKELNNTRLERERSCRRRASSYNNTLFAKKEYSSCIKDSKEQIRSDIKNEKKEKKRKRRVI